MVKRRALVSVSDKRGLGPFVAGIQGLGFEVFATGGTAKHLAGEGLQVSPVERLTGAGEMLGGRVKTLHPRIHAALLARREDDEHMAELRRLRISPIDMVVVNLYPFVQAASEADASVPELQDEIDIGGVALLRAGAKNWNGVMVVTNPDSYPEVLEELKSRGDLSSASREVLALEAFAHTSGYDAAIYNTLWHRLRPEDPVPAFPRLSLDRARSLRYGENPYQRAAFYPDSSYRGTCVAKAVQLMGRELSYNNILDFDSALSLAARFERPTAVVIKHTNPAGVASAEGAGEAYRRATATDPRSAYGCVLGFNTSVDAEAAVAMKGHFIEGIIAPSFTPEALTLLGTRKNLRLLRTDGTVLGEDLALVGVRGGLLAQTRGYPAVRRADLRTVTRRSPAHEELEGMLFGARILGHVKSNAIVLCRGEQTVGIGAGQMSRVDAVELASLKGGEAARGSVMVSDAFFPFRDGVDEAAKAGVTAVLQPGGSIRDEEVIAAANDHGMAMVFTGIRMFRH